MTDTPPEGDADEATSDFDLTSGIAFADLKAVHRSPAAYFARLETKGGREPDYYDTEAIRLALSMPYEFESYARNVIDKHGGVTEQGFYLSETTAINCGLIYRRITQNQKIKEILDGYQSSLIVSSDCKKTGLKRKALLNHVKKNPDEPAVVIKVVGTVDARPKSVFAQIEEDFIFAEAAYEADTLRDAEGVNVEVYGVLAIEYLPPFDYGLYVMPPEAIAKGREFYSRWLAIVAQCDRAQHWPGLATPIAKYVPTANFHGLTLPDFPPGLGGKQR